MITQQYTGRLTNSFARVSMVVEGVHHGLRNVFAQTRRDFLRVLGGFVGSTALPVGGIFNQFGGQAAPTPEDFAAATEIAKNLCKFFWEFDEVEKFILHGVSKSDVGDKMAQMLLQGHSETEAFEYAVETISHQAKMLMGLSQEYRNSCLSNPILRSLIEKIDATENPGDQIKIAQSFGFNDKQAATVRQLASIRRYYNSDKRISGFSIDGLMPEIRRHVKRQAVFIKRIGADNYLKRGPFEIHEEAEKYNDEIKKNDAHLASYLLGNDYY